jgi:UDP-3-O-[3-hydroxymyristoyl] N-acetylglucosamine deacetylase
LWSAGYALGASFDNTLVVSEDRVLNPDGLRFADEFVRHKVLDAVGDLALAGLPLIAAYKTVRGGHKLNHAVLSALMADASAWRVVEAAETPVRRGRAQAAGVVVPAYGPDKT